MFFDGNHTYTIEPGGQGSDHVSVHQKYTYWAENKSTNESEMEESVTYFYQAVMIADIRVFDDSSRLVWLPPPLWQSQLRITQQALPPFF